MHTNNSAAIARRLADQLWHEVQKQEKIAPGIWWFSCAGHGGIIVDIDVHPLAEPWKTQVLYRYKWYYPDEQHFAAFEEDCDGPIAEWLYAGQIHTSIFRQSFGEKELDDSTWFRKRIDLLRKCIERWNPEILDQYPKPGMGTALEKKLKERII